MPRGRPLAPLTTLTITDEQQEQLDGIARSDTLPTTTTREEENPMRRTTLLRRLLGVTQMLLIRHA